MGNLEKYMQENWPTQAKARRQEWKTALWKDPVGEGWHVLPN